tara:strand:- start:886 stop:1536 length:651 start_codon:yes stop_codon:yes gene_type:complete
MVTTLPVVEKFHSLQGEGAHAGRSAFFIRLASCKVKCAWCDTKNSWLEDSHPQESLSQLAASTLNAIKKGASFLVITGGEPLHHNLTPLCKAIRSYELPQHGNYKIPIHIETSGVNPLSGNPDWITLSPKRHLPPEQALLAACNELKIIVHEKEDLYFAEDMAKQAQSISSKEKQPLLFLQAGWSNKLGEKLAFEYVKSNPKWRLSVQTHKWLGIL